MILGLCEAVNPFCILVLSIIGKNKGKLKF